MWREVSEMQGWASGPVEGVCGCLKSGKKVFFDYGIDFLPS